MRYLVGFLVVISGFGQTNPLVGYLKLTPQQVTQLNANIQTLAPLVRGARDSGVNFNQNARAELDRVEIDRQSVGLWEVQFEMNCRDVQKLVSEVYGWNLALLTLDQKARLSAALTPSNAGILTVAAISSALRLTSAASDTQTLLFLNPPEPSAGLAVYLGFSQAQLDRMRAFVAAYEFARHEPVNRVSLLWENIDFALENVEPDVAAVGSMQAEMARWIQEIAMLQAACVQNNRSVLTPAQIAKLDSLAVPENLEALTAGATSLFLTSPAATRPASYGFYQFGADVLLPTPETRSCVYPETSGISAARTQRRTR